MTCIAQAAQRQLLQFMTTTYGFQFGGTPRTTPPCWIILFVKPQDDVFWLKLYEIGCMMHNFAPDVHGEVHIWNLDNLQRGTDGPKNTLNGFVIIGIEFYSLMSVAYAFNQRISETCLEAVWSGWTTKTHCPASAARWWFHDVFGWHYVGPTYATGGHGGRWDGYTIQEWHPPTYSATISAEFREEFVLMNENSRPHRAHLVNEFLRDNNIARLEWPACSPDTNLIKHATNTLKRVIFGRDDPPPLWEIYTKSPSKSGTICTNRTLMN